MKRLNYQDVITAKFDAGIYREYIAQNFGAQLKFGGLSDSYNQARRHCKKLAKITGKKEEEVIRDIVEDYTSIEE